MMLCASRFVQKKVASRPGVFAVRMEEQVDQKPRTSKCS